MLNWLNVVCVDFYTADVPVSEAMIRSAGLGFISINFHFFLKICFPSASIQTRFLFDFYNMTYPQRPWLWVSLLSMMLENNDESYPLDYTVSVHSSSSSSHFSFTQQQKPMNHLWSEHHFCTVCFRILHKYDHNITDVYKNTLSHVSVCFHNHFSVIKVHVKQTFWEETTWVKVTASQDMKTNSYLIHQLTKNQQPASLMIK